MISKASTTLDAFLSEYIAKRVDVKPTTRAHFERAKRNLVDFFGPDTLLSDITPADSDDFRADLTTKLADNTVRRICGRAKQFFRYAVRKRLLSESPFADMTATHVRANRAREFFVTTEIAYKVLEACPDLEWKLVFALSRWGGLRCPSEHLALRWSDVNWLDGRLRVPSPKTEHHEGKDSRIIPLFPEIRSWLLAAFEAAGRPTDGFVITKRRGMPTTERKARNWRTQLNLIIRKAGFTPWPKTFQNLRSTRETELADTYPIHVVVTWLGNSEAIAMQHYLQLTDEYFNRAIEGPK